MPGRSFGTGAGRTTLRAEPRVGGFRKEAAARERDGAMCGIVGYLRKSGCSDERPVGTVVMEMLRALAPRGPDSTGVALYGLPQADELRVRLKLADGEPDAALGPAVLAR